MIERPTPKKFRLRRTMLFLNAQRPGLLRDPFIFGSDSLILDLEDAVAENQKDAARFSLYHALTSIDYGETEVLVRINGIDTPHWREDVRVSVAGRTDGIRIPKCQTREDVLLVEEAIEKAEEEFGLPKGRTLLMAALESPLGILNAYEISTASNRLFGVAVSGGDLRKSLQVSPVRGGIELLTARGQVVLAARAAGVQCFDTVFTDLDDMDGFREEVIQNKQMGFDGKSLINPKQIKIVHEIFAPSQAEIREAEKILLAYKENAEKGIGVFAMDGKMIDVAFLPGAERIIALAKACGIYEGVL